MKIAILSRDVTPYSCQRLREVAEDYGHLIDVIDPLSCYMNIDLAAPTIHYRGHQRLLRCGETTQRLRQYFL